MSITDWKYLVPDTAADPGWSHSGIAVTDSGVVIFAEPSGEGLVLCRPDRATDGYLAERRKVPLLEIHGIFYEHDEHGERLWVADPGFKARRELGYETESRPGQAGSVDLATFEFTPLTVPPLTAAGKRWEPTSVVAWRESSDQPRMVVVADGYGAMLVHLYSDGMLVRTIDGSESGTAFSCPHGLVIDDRGERSQLIVADRGNRRLVYLELDGTFIRELVDPLLNTPSSLALRGSELLVTELDGALLAVSDIDAVRALIETRAGHSRDGWPNVRSHGELIRPPVLNGMLNSPHGIAVSADGRIYLTEWLIGGRQLELTLEDPLLA